MPADGSALPGGRMHPKALLPQVQCDEFGLLGSFTGRVGSLAAQVRLDLHADTAVVPVAYAL